jgi:hypothetical protein
MKEINRILDLKITSMIDYRRLQTWRVLIGS